MDPLDNAQIDSLTGCCTKDSLVPFMEKEIAEYSVYKVPFSILIIDIDGFKGFNDKHGHIFGDEALKYFSSSLRLNLEEEECGVVRFGGDEFVLIFPGRTSKETYKLAVRVESSIKRRPFLFKGDEYRISFSGGVASYPADSAEIEDMLEKADKAMYFSKRHGPGRITQYSRVRLVSLERLITRIAAAVAIAAIFVIGRYVFKINLKTIRAKALSISKGAPLVKVNPVSKRPSTIYLKSGHSIYGIITGENEADLFVKFDISSGEGSVIIKKSDIDHIEN